MKWQRCYVPKLYTCLEVPFSSLDILIEKEIMNHDLHELTIKDTSSNYIQFMNRQHICHDDVNGRWANLMPF